MPSSNALRGVRHSRGQVIGLAWFVASLVAFPSNADAQQQPQGFAVERFYPSAPGGGWMVMDDLDMHGGLGGALAISSGYAHNPLRVTDGTQRLKVVSDQAFADLGLALTFDRFRFYLNFTAPLSVKGESGTVGDYQLTAPGADVGSNPDTLSDARVGFDARLLGHAKRGFRLGAGLQVIVPSGERADYVTDGTYRLMGRVLFAGRKGFFTYAGQLGVHVRPLNDAPAPGSPRGSELLFGVAGGPRFPVGSGGNMAVIVGPEFYGETAFRSFLGATTTGLEGLLTGRLEETGDHGPQRRVKLGVGGGLNPHFGAPEWRFVVGVEVFSRSFDR